MSVKGSVIVVKSNKENYIETGNELLEKHKINNLTLKIFKDNRMWIVQCLEYDICAQGNTFQSALKAFSDTFLGQAVLDVKSGKKVFEDISPAPF